MNPSVLRRCLLPATCGVAGMVLAAAGMTVFSGFSQKPAVVAESPAPRLAWRDLADPNTARFAENLRAIGCPENTILRIITVGAPAAAPAAPVVAPIAEASAAPVIPVVVAVPPPAPVVPMTPPAAPAAPAGPEMVIVAPEGKVPLPVAFQDMPQDGQMTAEQLAKLSAIQDAFLAEIGGPNQDPASPEYLERWRQAQPKCDEAFRAVFGQAAFLRRYMAAVREQPAAVPGS